MSGGSDAARLAKLLDEKRKELSALTDRVSSYEEKEAEYAQTLCTVSRLWDRLNSDICHLSAGSVSKDDRSNLSTLISPCPFVDRLLQGASASTSKTVTESHKQLEASLTSVEEALMQRASNTQEALTHVLHNMQHLRERNTTLAQQLATQINDAVLKEEAGRLAQELASTRLQLDHSHAASRIATERLQAAEDRSLEAEERVKKLQNELADMEQQLSSLQRKFAAFKDRGPELLAVPKDPAAGVVPVSVPSTIDSLQEDLAEEVLQLQQTLDKRLSDLEKERESHFKTKLELSEMSARLGDEQWVPGTRTYQQMQAEIQRVNDLLAAKARDLESLARERDEAIREIQIKNQYFHAEGISRQKISALEKSCREFQMAKLEGDRMRQDLELQLLREREKGGNTETMEELNAVISALQDQVSSLQEHIKLNKVAEDRLASSSKLILEAQEQAEAKVLEAQRLTDKLRRKDLDLEEQKKREQGLKDRVNDLKAFVDVLTVYCNDARDVTEIRASEAALKEQVCTLKAQIEGHGLQQRVRELEACERAARDQIDLMVMESDSLRVEITRNQGEISELSTQLQASLSECQLYVAEIETTSSAYEDMLSQNGRLLKMITDKDDLHNQMQTERIKILQGQQQLQDQFEMRGQEIERLNRDIMDVLSQKDLLEKEVARLAAEIVMVKESARLQTSRADALTLDLRRQEEAAAFIQAQHEGLQKQVSDCRLQLQDSHENLSKEKTKKQKLEGDNKLLSVKLDRLRKNVGGGSGTVDKELQEENDAMRQLLNCNVCHERQKNVIITKCCHVFCDKCIKRNLDARNRKCPGCGVPFGQADVKQFFHT